VLDLWSSPAQRDAQPAAALRAWAGALSLISVFACATPGAQQLSCNDTLPAQSVSFDQLSALVFDPLKGCTASGCHSGDTQQHGIRLDTPQLIYAEFSLDAADVYATLASERMPYDGVPWDEDDLRRFRTWYCNGAFPP
jgi:hypothetical protein